FEQLDHAESTINKLDEFLSPLLTNIVGQSKSTIDLRTIMDEGKILLVKLSPKLNKASNLIGSILIALFLLAAYSRSETRRDKRKQHNLYVDEFQNFSTEDFSLVLTETRKYGLASTISHQSRYQLDEENSGASLNVANLVVFKIS